MILLLYHVYFLNKTKECFYLLNKRIHHNRLQVMKDLDYTENNK